MLILNIPDIWVFKITKITNNICKDTPNYTEAV